MPVLKDVTDAEKSAARKTRRNVSSASRSVKPREILVNSRSSHNKLNVAMKIKRNSSNAGSNVATISKDEIKSNHSVRNSNASLKSEISVGNSNGRNSKISLKSDSNVGNSNASSNSSRSYNVEVTSNVATNSSESISSAVSETTSKGMTTAGVTRNVCEISSSNSNNRSSGDASNRTGIAAIGTEIRIAIAATPIVIRTGNVDGSRISNVA